MNDITYPEEARRATVARVSKLAPMNNEAVRMNTFFDTAFKAPADEIIVYVNNEPLILIRQDTKKMLAATLAICDDTTKITKADCYYLGSRVEEVIY